MIKVDSFECVLSRIAGFAKKHRSRKDLEGEAVFVWYS